MASDFQNHFNVTTTATISNKSKTWYTQDNENIRRYRVGNITVPVICALFILIFCVAIFVFVLYFRRQKFKREHNRLMMQQITGNTLSQPEYWPSSTRLHEGLQAEATMKKSLPPYPGPPVNPPSYEVACGNDQRNYI